MIQMIQGNILIVACHKNLTIFRDGFLNENISRSRTFTIIIIKITQSYSRTFRYRFLVTPNHEQHKIVNHVCFTLTKTNVCIYYFFTSIFFIDFKPVQVIDWSDGWLVALYRLADLKTRKQENTVVCFHIYEFSYFSLKLTNQSTDQPMNQPTKQ